MTILDRYILKQFLLNIIFGVITFICIFIVVDMMENIDKFLDAGASTLIIIQFYFYFIPEIIKLMLPVAMLLASLFTTGKLSTYNELTAIRSSGVSSYRIMTPFFIVALIISIAAIYFNGWIVPYANQSKYRIDRVYMHRNLGYINRDNLFFQDKSNTLMNIGYFDDISLSALKVSIQMYDQNRLSKMVARYDAPKMQFDSTTTLWTLYNVKIREFQNDKEILKNADSLVINLNFKPHQILREQQKPDEMNYTEMGEFISTKKQSGYNMAKWTIEYYSKISFPFASFIVVLFGVPFSLNKRRAGMSIQFGISLLICFIYLVFMKITNVFGYNGDLNPLLTAWLANIVFFIVAILNLYRSNK
jgi:lipopolysaccharide export system permease protein